jgi:hypothetical protein
MNPSTDEEDIFFECDDELPTYSSVLRSPLSYPIRAAVETYPVSQPTIQHLVSRVEQVEGQNRYLEEELERTLEELDVVQFSLLQILSSRRELAETITDHSNVHRTNQTADMATQTPTENVREGPQGLQDIRIEVPPSSVPVTIVISVEITPKDTPLPREIRTSETQTSETRVSREEQTRENFVKRSRVVASTCVTTTGVTTPTTTVMSKSATPYLTTPRTVRLPEPALDFDMLMATATVPAVVSSRQQYREQRRGSISQEQIVEDILGMEEAMDLSAQTKVTTEDENIEQIISRATREERARAELEFRREMIVCYKCGGKGHMMRDCQMRIGECPTVTQDTRRVVFANPGITQDSRRVIYANPKGVSKTGQKERAIAPKPPMKTAVPEWAPSVRTQGTQGATSDMMSLFVTPIQPVIRYQWADTVGDGSGQFMGYPSEPSRFGSLRNVPGRTQGGAHPRRERETEYIERSSVFSRVVSTVTTPVQDKTTYTE